VQSQCIVAAVEDALKPFGVTFAEQRSSGRSSAPANLEPSGDRSRER
jgi:hypothetical protein